MTAVSKLAIDYHRAIQRALKAGRRRRMMMLEGAALPELVKACWCLSKGLVPESTTRCPRHRNTVASGLGRKYVGIEL